jgi:alpha-L-rhamnosidase
MDGVPVELLDARELDPVWVDPDFDDTGWAPAAVVKVSHIGGAAHSQPPVDPYGAMLPRGTAALTGDEMTPVGVVVQAGLALPDGSGPGTLPDHPAHRLIAQLAVVGQATAAGFPVTIQRDSQSAPDVPHFS